MNLWTLVERATHTEVEMDSKEINKARRLLPVQWSSSISSLDWQRHELKALRGRGCKHASNMHTNAHIMVHRRSEQAMISAPTKYWG